MARNVSPDFVSLITSDQVELFYAVDFFFDSSTLRLWTGIGNAIIQGNTYTGTGSLMSIEGLSEGSDLGAKGARVVLSGIDSSIVSTALSEPYQNRACEIYLGILDGTENYSSTIVTADATSTTADATKTINNSSVAKVFSGLMDVMTIEDSGDTSTIAISIESKLITLDRPRIKRYTNESHVSQYPNDTFFSYITDLQDKPIVWGRKQDD